MPDVKGSQSARSRELRERGRAALLLVEEGPAAAEPGAIGAALPGGSPGVPALAGSAGLGGRTAALAKVSDRWLDPDFGRLGPEVVSVTHLMPSM